MKRNSKGRILSALFALAMTLSAVMLFVSTPVAKAQSTSGDVVGTVSDKSGAAIPNALVSAKNQETGVITQAKANSVGDFHIPNLPIGKYDITATADGFSSFTLKGFQVILNNTATAKLTLGVASATSVVEVSAEASAVLDTTTVQLQSSFETQELKNLPVSTVGNGVLNLSLLVPGVASSGAVGAGTGPSVGGQRPRADNYEIEGIDNNNKSVTGPLVYVPNDAVGEFTVVTNQFSPEFGHSAGGQFNTVVTSGTNKIHGAAYEYFQNRNLNAENAIAGGKVPNPRYDFNRYGGQVGGPVIKDRLFYFGNFERQTTGQSSSYYLCTPTADGMAALATIPNVSSTNLGIFTKYTVVSPSQVDYASDNACFNESPKTPGAGGDPMQYLNVYPGTDLSSGPVYNPSQPIYGSGQAITVPLGNYNVQAPSYSNFDVLTLSTDYKISENDSFRGRYIYNKFTGIDTAAALPAFYQPIPDDFHLIALSEFHNFTANLINEARIGYNRFFNETPSGNYQYPGLDSFPTLYTYDSGFLEIGPDGNAPQSTIQNLYQFTDNISWIKGKHNFKFGFDGRKYISPQSFTQRVRGDYEYNYLTEYLHDLAPTAFGERSTGNFFYYGDQTALYGYGNDVWRITEKLSLNYGLRYEFTSVPVGDRAQALNSAASVPGLIEFKEPKPQKFNFLPRVGINYALDVNTSIRAGFGMATDVLYDNLGILSFPPQYSSTNDVGSGSNASPGDPNFLADGGLPKGNGSLATFCLSGTGPGTGVTCQPDIPSQQAATSAFVPDQKLPYAETWTLGVQHVFAKDYTAEIRYVGTRGIHLPTQNQLNVQPKADAEHNLPTYIGTSPTTADLAALPNTLATINARSARVPAFFDPNNPSGPNFQSKITTFMPWSESNYNGMAASLVRRFKGGYLLDFAYTYSRTMDDATADVFSTVLTPRRPQDSRNVKADYSRSALDRTHRLTLAGVYDMPFFKSSGWLMKNVVGNWEVAPIFTYESPEYYTVLSGVNSNLNGDSTAIDRTIYNKSGKYGTGSGVTAIYDPSRAGLCTGVDSNGNPITTCSANLVAYQAIDPTARYIVAGKGSLPTSERNTQPINPITNLDATASKRFNFTERYSLEFQAQAFNVLNHAQYMPGTVDNINSPGYTSQISFQTASNADFNQPQKFFAANARTMQLALKFSF